MRKTALIVLLVAFVLLLGSSLVLAADVFLQIEKPASIKPNSQFTVQVSVNSNQGLNGLQIPLSFFHNTNNDIRCDSIQWTSSFLESKPTMYAGQDGDMSYLHNDSKTMAVVAWAVWFGDGLPAGNGEICKLYFSTGNSWTGNLPLDLTDNLDPLGPAEASDKEGHALPLAFKVNEGGNSGDDGGSALPTEFKLHQNYPNPFNPATTIEFDLPKAGPVTVDIYNTRGQKVKSYRQDYSPGRIRIVWDGKDNSGNSVASGTYFCRVSADDKTFAKKMILVK